MRPLTPPSLSLSLSLTQDQAHIPTNTCAYSVCSFVFYAILEACNRGLSFYIHHFSSSFSLLSLFPSPLSQESCYFWWVFRIKEKRAELQRIKGPESRINLNNCKDECFEIHQMCHCGRWGCRQDLHAHLLHQQQISYC